MFNLRSNLFKLLLATGSISSFKIINDNIKLINNKYYSYCETSHNNNNNKIKKKDIIIIGGGVVGLSVARECAVKYNASVLVIEKEDVIAAGASSGNSGLGCTGYDAPTGSLERKLLRRSIQIHQNLYRSFGLSHDHVKKCGSLVVAWTPNELLNLQNVLNENIEAGDKEVLLLTREELHELEPSISKESLGGVLLPHEAIVEPWLVPISYAENAMRNGVEIITSKKVISTRFNNDLKEWYVDTVPSNDCALGRSINNELLVKKDNNNNNNNNNNNVSYTSNIVINCAGLYGDEIEKMRIKGYNNNNNNNNEIAKINDNIIKVVPRKGQFIVFKPNKTTLSPHYIIEPVASEFTKGIIVWTTVYGNIIVGPTAVNINEKNDRSTDINTINMLRKYGEKVIPSLKDATVIGTYSGLRPSTQYRDYQIHSIPSNQWITVGGIRSTGLTASSGIGEYVGLLYSQLIDNNKKINFDNNSNNNNKDGLIGVSEASLNPLSNNNNSSSNNKEMTIPSLKELSLNYNNNIDKNGNIIGIVEIFNKKWRVTHPISSFGMETYNSDDDDDDDDNNNNNNNNNNNK